jgi:hypothetical protein
VSDGHGHRVVQQFLLVRTMSASSQQGQPQGSSLKVTKATTDDYRAEDNADPKFFIEGRVRRTGLTFRIRTRDLQTNQTSALSAKVFFDAMMQALEPGDPSFYAVIGDWSNADPDYVSNLYFFNQSIAAGKTRDDAASSSSTGQLAKDWGYVEVDFVTLDPPGATKNFARVLVRFINPGK